MNTVTEKTAIEKLIFSYGDAFNNAHLPATVALYTAEGILMPNNAPLAQGPEQLTAAFGFLFNTFKIKVEYNIDEVIITGDYAYARTHSTIATFVIASGETILLANKELFVLQKSNGEWKIARYIFNNTKKLN